MTEAPPVRLRRLVETRFDFVWRSLRRLGVPASDVDDQAQRVFLVAARKLENVVVDREASFLFGVALRVAAEHRRTVRRRREDGDDALVSRADPAPSPEDEAEGKNARARLDEMLEAMPLELRTVFVLFELEEMSTVDIATLLELPTGTVASRLRRARDDFRARVSRLRARRAFEGEP